MAATSATPATPGVRVVGAPRAPLSDVYHLFLRTPWSLALTMVVACYFALNAVFAVAYLIVGGVQGLRPGSFADAYAFSIQTMGTIGYGAMYPVSPAGHVLVAIESVTGLVVTALATGLIFAKFSRTTSRIVFTRHVTISPMDGKPTLSLRVGNERENAIMEAQVRLSLVRTERTQEGMTFYRLVDLKLARERSPAVARSWMIMHPIDADSPLFGKTPAQLKADEVELIVTLVGVDDTSLQPVHARKNYTDAEIVWGSRHADVLTETPDGTLVLDVGKFHDLVPTEPSPAFPYGTPKALPPSK
jgi:inward rectifier potassium channel